MLSLAQLDWKILEGDFPEKCFVSYFTSWEESHSLGCVGLKHGGWEVLCAT